MFCLLPLEVSGRQDTDSGQTALVFTHVTVIDATGAPRKSDMTVVVRGSRIEALGETSKLTVPRNTHVVDGTGEFLIPGLLDMHVHWYNKDSLVVGGKIYQKAALQKMLAQIEATAKKDKKK